jgi:glycosyltransferase involved in cell wall biosynthesis
MYHGHRISAIVPAHNEEATIALVVQGLRENPVVDEVLVVENLCKDRTADLAREAGARVVSETKAGYGHALRCGMDHATGEILVLTEADGSFRPEDVEKFLAYLDDAGLVVGTRTTKQMVGQGANMQLHLRLGNLVMAKVLEVFWWASHEPRFTDVGCTYRALWKDAYRKMRAGLREAGPAFSVEMMAEAMRQGLRVIEIPIHYDRRHGGESKHSKTFANVLRTAWMMFKAIVRKRVEGRSLPAPGPKDRPVLARSPSPLDSSRQAATR